MESKIQIDHWFPALQLIDRATLIVNLFLKSNQLESDRLRKTCHFDVQMEGVWSWEEVWFKLEEGTMKGWLLWDHKLKYAC